MPNPTPPLLATNVQEHLLGAGVVLYGATLGRLRVLDEASATAWVAITEGADLEAVTRQLVAKLGRTPDDLVKRRVEALVDSWVADGLLLRRDAEPPSTASWPGASLANWRGALVGEDVRTAFVAVPADTASGLVAALVARGVPAATSTTFLVTGHDGDVELSTGEGGRVLGPSRVVFAAAGYPDIVALDPGAALAAALGGGLSVAPGLASSQVEALLAWFDRGGMRCVFADNPASLERLVAVMAGARPAA